MQEILEDSIKFNNLRISYVQINGCLRLRAVKEEIDEWQTGRRVYTSLSIVLSRMNDRRLLGPSYIF